VRREVGNPHVWRLDPQREVSGYHDQFS